VPYLFIFFFLYDLNCCVVKL